MKKRLLIFTAISLTVISLVGCSGNDDSYKTADSSYDSSNYKEDNSNTDDSSSSSSGSYKSDSSSYSDSSSKTIEHYCQASGCTKEGTKTIVGLNNTLEYYCYTHYKEMEDIVNNMVEDVKSSSTTSFTNKYGTSTTKCAHSGCDNYIASSGDTNCCTTHSKKCGECGCYIDEDAMFCISCLEKALQQN